MVTKELVDYIQEEIKIGKNLNDITTILLNTGWTKQDVDGAMEQARYNLSKEKPKAQQPQNVAASPNVITKQEPQKASTFPKKIVLLLLVVILGFIVGLIVIGNMFSLPFLKISQTHQADSTQSNMKGVSPTILIK